MNSASDTCEVKVKEIWITRTIDQALTLHKERVLRCPECYGQVRAHKEGAGGMARAHFEHVTGHEGCSRGIYFKGNKSPHPRSLK